MSSTVGADGVQRLLISRRRVMTGSLGLPILLGVAGFALEAIPIGLLLSRPAAAVVVLALVLLVAFPVVAIVVIVAGVRQARMVCDALPEIEATPETLSMSDAEGHVVAVPRDRVASVVWLLASEYLRGSRIQFRDADDRTIAQWDLTTAGRPAFRWLGQLGYPTATLTGRAALEVGLRPDEATSRGRAQHAGGRPAGLGAPSSPTPGMATGRNLAVKVAGFLYGLGLVALWGSVLLGGAMALGLEPGKWAVTWFLAAFGAAANLFGGGLYLALTGEHLGSIRRFISRHRALGPDAAGASTRPLPSDQVSE